MTKSITEPTSKTTDDGKEYLVLGLLALGIFIVWLLLGILPTCITQASDERGQIGDMFGMANSLFSAFAFAGLIYTIWLQRKELALQREELRMTRDELEKAALAQNASAEALRQQVLLAAITAKISGQTSLMPSLEDEVKARRAVLQQTNPDSNEYGVRKAAFEKRSSQLHGTLNNLEESIMEIDALIANARAAVNSSAAPAQLPE